MKYQTLKQWSLGVAAAAVLSTNAFALTIDPAVDTPDATGNQTANPQVLAAVAAITGGLAELYKQNVGGGESGALAGSYSATFANSPGDPEDSTITYDGGDIVGPTAWLLVKDGNHSPAWYLYNLTSLNWDGKETLELENFWPGSGAISHVSLFGVPDDGTVDPPPPPPTPDSGATAVLLGSSLLGLGWFSRRRKK